jgi:hypothetical protein
MIARYKLQHFLNGYTWVTAVGGYPESPIHHTDTTVFLREASKFIRDCPFSDVENHVRIIDCWEDKVIEFVEKD